MGFTPLTDVQHDALQAMSNVGMDHAATALSQLMKRNIHLKVPRVLAVDVAAVPELLGGEQQIVVGIFLQILGDARGNIMLVFTRANAMHMLDNLLSRNMARGTLLTELELSTLKEVGNILASAYLNALGDRLKMTLIPSVPLLSFDLAGAVVDYLRNEQGEVGDVSFMIETEFSEDDNNFSGNFFLMPAPRSLDLILEKIGV